MQLLNHVHMYLITSRSENVGQFKPNLIMNAVSTEPVPELNLTTLESRHGHVRAPGAALG